jgi:aspartate--ammonia ligase
MESFIIPKEYKNELSLHETQVAIKELKDIFQQYFSYELDLLRVSAPIFVKPESGLNDNLNGVERPVSFDLKENHEYTGEVVQSLAKWKRYALGKYNFEVNTGLYTDMNAIRRDEKTDNIHSIYVDQWDWEKVINKEDRTEETLKSTVEKIYRVLKMVEKFMSRRYSYIKEIMPEKIFFITSQELLDMYPNDTPKDREYKIAKEKGAVFVMKIGKTLSNGEVHDGRAPDYDDWELNGDIIVYYPVLDIALELSSMGIRVDEDSMVKQCKIRNCEDRLKLTFHQDILNKKLPYSIGGGIGQSRICMFFLRKAHIGEIHCSIWPKETEKIAKENGILLL